jgi:hypothetical protein
MTKQNKLVTGIIALIFSVSSFGQYKKIELPIQDAYVSEHAKDDFKKLVDNDITTRYTQWSPKTSPYTITFPCYDSIITIKQMKFRLNTGNPSTLKFYYVANGVKTLFYSYAGGTWTQDWRIVDVSGVPATAFIIESKGGDDFPDDIELYGTTEVDTKVISNRTHAPLSDLLGVVVKPWDVASDYMFPEKVPSILSLGVNRVRLYNDYPLAHDANGNLIANNGMWHQFTNMKLMKAKGISTQMCYLSLPSTYPWPPAGDKSDPATYLKLAQDVYWFGKANKDSGEVFKTFELLNEDGAWYNPSYQFDGYQLAAMLSICYDGHKGKFPNVGLKASGTTALFSNGGLAEQEPYLLYQMMDWSIKNRGYRADGTPDLPFDVYSFHLYSSLEGQRQGIPGGVAPEYGAAPYMRKVAKIRDRFFPWLKIHIGEWAWDINSGSSLNAPAFGKYSAHQTSGMWTVRELLWMAANGIDASSFYRIKQDYDPQSDANPTAFETMALTRQWSAGSKMPDGSYTGFDMRRTLTGDYFKQLSEIFNNGFAFDSLVSQSPIVMRFKKSDSLVYAIWEKEDMTITTRPQFTEKTGSYTLNVKGKIRRLVDDSSGKMSSEDFAGGTIAYGSKPVFVVASTTIQPVPVPTKTIFHKGYFTLSTGSRFYYIMYSDKTYVQTNSKYQPL